uniref:Methylcytosine dioxygenase TET n=1 Tax=Pipistrellus kuhlii TaxID=59472 RepID=A0A7J7VD69_PIPKU|nr:tet methylcytosine dioxygenase 1 [Pipistrellus kuhlii]
MSRSRHAKPSRFVRRDDLSKKKNSQLKKTFKPINKNVTPGKTMSPRKLKKFIQARDVKKKEEPKPPPPMPARSLLTRAGAARLNLERAEALFRNPESLTCNGFTMTLRRTSLSRRLSQPPVVIAKPKKVSPPKNLEKPRECDRKGKASENDSVPTQDLPIPPDLENLIDVQDASSSVQEERQGAAQSWCQRVEDSKIDSLTHGGPVAEILSGALEGTHDGEGLFSKETLDDSSDSPGMFAQEDPPCAPLPQQADLPVTSEGNSSVQVDDLGSQVESLKLSDSYLDPVPTEQDCCPTSSFNTVIPELDLGNYLSFGGRLYSTSLLKLFLASSAQGALGAKPDHLEVLEAPPDQQEIPGNTPVLGQAFSAVPHPWEIPGVNLVHGGALGETPVPPELAGAISVQGQVFGAILNQEILGVGGSAASDPPVFLPAPLNPVATYNALPGWPDPQSTISYGLEVQGTMQILSLGSGHTPQPTSVSEVSAEPPPMAMNNAENEKQVHLSFPPADTQGFELAPEGGPHPASQDLAQHSQAVPGQSEGGSSPIDAPAVSTPVPLASTSSPPSHTTVLPALEKKKRKRCGVCVPCQQKANCGECTYCINRKNSHQICKKRKCEELKKKLPVPKVIKENKRPKREKKPKVLKADFKNKIVNGPESVSMDYSGCGHGEEKRLELNSHPPENVTENDGSMTGIEVEKWTQSKKSQLTDQVKGEVKAIVTEGGKLGNSEDDPSEVLPEPQVLFAQTVTNGIENVHYIPTETEVSVRTFSIEECDKVSGNNSCDPLVDSASQNNAMSSAATNARDHLPGRSDVSVFQQPDSESFPDPADFSCTSPTGTPTAREQPKPLENIPSTEPNHGSPVQQHLLSLVMDRTLTQEQVDVIEALAQLSGTPAANASPSKSEEDKKNDQMSAGVLNKYTKYTALFCSIKDLEERFLQGGPHSLFQGPSVEKQGSCNTVLFNGQSNVSTSHGGGAATDQVSTEPQECSNEENSTSLFTPNSSSPEIDTSKNAAQNCSTQDSRSENLHESPPPSGELGSCSQLLDSSRTLAIKDEPSWCQDTVHSQIEEDVAAQLTQLASVIKFRCPKPEETSEASTSANLVYNVQRHSQEKNKIKAKPRSSVKNNHGSSTKQKIKTRKKTKSTPSKERRKKKPAATNCQENAQKRQEQLSSEYNRLHDIWIASKFQRFGQFGPRDFPLLLGKVPPVPPVRAPLTPKKLAIKYEYFFPPLAQIKFQRNSELEREEMMNVDHSTSHLQTESNGQAFKEEVPDSPVHPVVNVHQKAHPGLLSSSLTNQCANVMPDRDQTQFQQDGEDQPMHPSLPALPSTSHETPSSHPGQVLRNVNVESSGGITVVSTTNEEDVSLPSGGASQVAPVENAHNFHNYAMNFLTNSTRNLVSTTTNSELPSCNCDQKEKGPYYTHLGAGPNVAAVREIMENRYGQRGSAVRIEKVIYTGKEAKSSRGCPVAKWVLRRSSEEEKILCLVRERTGHHCPTAVTVVLILVWDGIPLPMADRLYTELTENLRTYNGHPTDRRCTLNEKRTCTCQGIDPETCGASFSFGCSWSMFFNGCKFGRSSSPRRFRIDPSSPLHEKNLEDNLQSLATQLAPIYKQYAPVAYQNQVQFEHTAQECRLGNKEGRPFSGVTACVDFCTHAHRDIHNMNNGSTVVCTLTREDNRSFGIVPQDEQLHVLPLYKLSDTDEFDSREGMEAKVRSGAIDVLKPRPKKRTCFRQPIPRCGKKRTSRRTDVFTCKMKAMEKKLIPRIKRKNNSTTHNSKASSLSLLKKCETEPNFVFKGSNNIQTSSPIPSIPHPVQKANLSPNLSSSANTASTTKDASVSGGFPERSSNPDFTMSSERHSDANAAAAAGECSGIAQPGEVSPLPTLPTPMSDSLVGSEPPAGPSEQMPPHEPNQQPPLSTSAPALASSLKEEDGQHSAAAEPPSDAPPSHGPQASTVQKLPHLEEYWSDSEHIFLDDEVGGVAIAPAHGSVLIECARRELHATTPVRHPNRNHPTRLSLVFYQHKNLNSPHHGFEKNKIKYEAKDKEAKSKKIKVSDQSHQAANEGPELSPEVMEMEEEVPSRKAVTLTHDNVVTVAPYAVTHVAGPYNHWV